MSFRPRYKGRNLNFTTQLTEFQLGIQYYIFPLAKGKLSPYVFASADVFHFNPYTHAPIYVILAKSLLENGKT